MIDRPVAEIDTSVQKVDSIPSKLLHCIMESHYKHAIYSQNIFLCFRRCTPTYPFATM